MAFSIKQLLSILILGSSAVFIQPLYAETNAPAISFQTANGQVDLQSLKGKTVYIDFWASWCTPCRKSFPWMNAMQQKYKDNDLVILAVNLDKDKSQVTKFLKKYPADFIIAYDAQGNSAELFGVKGMPHSFLLNRQGKIVSSHIGFRSKDTKKLEQSIISTLNSN